MSAVTIDLGEVDDGWTAGVDERSAGLPRSWGLFATLALVLSLVSAGPLPEPPREVTRQPLRNGEFHLAGGALFVLDSDRTPTPVEAFDAVDGSSRWTYTPDALASLSHVTTHGGLAVFSPDLCRSGITGVTVAVDLATGRQRWVSAGVPVRTPPGDPGTLVMRTLWSDGCRALADSSPIAGTLRWQSIDAAGAIRWDTAVEPGTRVAVDAAAGGATWAALLDRDGGLSVVDFATGVRSAAVAGVVPFEADVIAAVGDLLLVARWDETEEHTALTAYRRGTAFAPAWQALLPTGPAPGRSDRFAIEPCGAALCVTGLRTVVLDPATGSMLWTAARTTLLPAPGGLLRPANVGVLVLDAATGMAVHSLPAWRVLGVDGQRMLLGLPSDGSTLLAWSDGADATPFATVPGAFVSCEIDGATVACNTEADEVLLLKIGPRPAGPRA